MKILVTGASGGIGSALVKRLLVDGHEIIAVNRTPREVIDITTVNQMLTLTGDLSKLDGLRKLQRELSELSIDGFVHCAGVAEVGKIGRLEPDKIQEMFVLNSISPILLLNQILPLMIKQKFGRIVLVGSIVGDSGGVGLSAYAATKSALKGLNKSINREIQQVKEHDPYIDITTNLIKPGYTDSNMTKNMKESIKKEIQTNSTIKRFLKCDEIASEIIHLLSTSSSYLSGSEVAVNGGQTL